MANVNKIALFIDGENLRHYVESIIQENGYRKEDYSMLDIDFNKMFSGPLNRLVVSKKIYYSGKIQFVQETEKISNFLIEKQRSLKAKIEKQGFTFLIAGKVRPQIVSKNGKEKIIFKEKGVDVRIAVDLIKTSVDKNFQTIILCCSDSDLQPAIKEARLRGLKIIYLGYENIPNKGITYTTDKTILIRNSEIIEALDKTKQLKID